MKRNVAEPECLIRSLASYITWFVWIVPGRTLEDWRIEYNTV